jgi:y4mF family transcriptional regulator
MRTHLIPRSEPFISLGGAVRERRKALRLTQADIAVLADCAELFVREVEAGKPTVQFNKLVALLKALGLELRVSIGPRGLVVNDCG